MTAKGWLTGISRRIGELHLAACREARPDQVELAGQLAELELTSELDTFHRAAATYADVLGPDGIAAYRRIVEPNWRAAKKNKDPLWARSVRCDPGDDRRRLGPVVIPTTSSPSEAATSTRPTTTWRSHGRWSQPGGKPSRWTGLGAALTRSSTGSGRRPRCASSSPLSSGPPATIRRQRTSGGRRSRPTRPSTATASFSPRAPMPRPDGEKPSISSASASTQATPKQGRAIRCSNGPPATTLVEILLYEGRADEAWSAATAHGCDERMWMTLARAREGTHPFDAIPIYERAVAAQTDMKNNGGYRAAVDLLARIRTLATKADQPERFSDLLSAVKTEHDRKRNLMALIDKKRWS